MHVLTSTVSSLNGCFNASFAFVASYTKVSEKGCQAGLHDVPEEAHRSGSTHTSVSTDDGVAGVAC